MRIERMEAWLRNIYATRDVEISCTECFELVSRFVEVEGSGADAAAQFPLVRQHLDQCRACQDEYETLRDLRCLDAAGELPSADQLQSWIGEGLTAGSQDR